MTVRKSIHSLADATGVAAAGTDPVWVEIENGDGPTVIVAGGVHGDEYEAQVVIRRVAEEIDPSRVRGRLVLIPVLNYPAAEVGRRVCADDGQNMNRVFPGKADGTPTERIAHWLVTRLFPGADLLIDVHAGGRDVAVVPMVFGFADAGCRVPPERLEAIMRGWGYGLIQHMDCVPGTVCHAALEAGLASVEVEGGGGRMLSGEIAVMQDGLLNGLAACHVLAGAVPAFSGIEVDAPEAGQVYAPEDGVVEHLVALGARVVAGERIANLHPLTGATAKPRPVIAPVDGILLRQTQHAWLARGRQIGNIGILRR